MRDDILLALHTLESIVKREIYQRANALSHDVATVDIRHSLEILEEAIDREEMTKL